MSKAVSIYKKKYEDTKKRLSSALKRAGSGTKSMGLGAGAGAAAAFAVDFAAEKVDFIRDNWWGPGAAIGAAALVVRKKSRDAAIALAGAAGFSLAQSYKRKDDAPSASNTQGYGYGGYDASGADASGLYDG